MFSLNNISATMSNMTVSRPRRMKTTPTAHKALRSFSDSSPLSNPRLDRGTPLRDISNIEQPSKINETPSSIHLSEFVQPPRSTSTPNQDLSLDKRPAGYSTPLFRFDSRVVEDQLANSYMLHDTNESLVSSSIITNMTDESPLAPYNTDRRKRLLEQSFCKDCGPNGTPNLGSSVNYDEVDTDDLINIDHVNIGKHSIREDFRMMNVSDIFVDTHQIRSQSIPVSDSQNPCGSTSKKRVRINDDVEFIDSNGMSSRKRTSAAAPSLTKTLKRKRLTQNVNLETDYTELLKLCGEEKDPLALLRF